jgi:high-affinity Fe2+/Pb2+ permease
VVDKKLENTSYKIIIASAAMVAFGVLLGSFVSFTVYVGVLGAFLVIIGIVVFIVSQFLEEGIEKHEEHHEEKSNPQ